jgi:acyl-CoA dehydrogenase
VRFSCLWVNRDAPGISIGANAKLPGLKVNPFCSIGFDGVEISDTWFIGQRGDAYALYRRTLDLYFGMVAACAMGAARAAYQRAFAYARERFQYGQLIIKHQEIQRLLGNMHNKIAVGTAVYRGAFEQEDYGEPIPRLDGRAAKVFCTDAALEIALDAVQIHGGYGYMHDYYVEKIMRDVKVLQLLGGSSPALNIESIREQLIMKEE